jgi:primosomal protein N' (replication factor Y)
MLVVSSPFPTVVATTPPQLDPDGCLAAEAGSYYPASSAWIEVLVDCSGVEGLFTYRIPAGMAVQPGDILSVPFGHQQLGAIAIRYRDQAPPDLDINQLREVEAVVSAGFFPPDYWTLLNRVADYYHTPLMQVIRAALPPGLLARSQRRIRLTQPTDADRRSDQSFADLQLSPPAQRILAILQASKAGDYSWQYLHRQVKGASRALTELQRIGQVENYLEPPSPIRPKLRQAVTLVVPVLPPNLTPRQQEIWQVLKRQGGELWLTDLLQQCQTSSATLKAMVQKGCVVIQEREVLRTETGVAVGPDHAKPLTPDQTQALEQIQQIEGFAQVLLHGVTGSGKTEVYLQAIAPVLHSGRSVLVLVPEIGLTPQLTDRFRARFGHQVCVYHSGLSEGERYDTWRQMLSGQTQVVIGTRSAIFAPLPTLGLIILDEEHDSSFKQDQPVPCYHARTVAQWRAQLANCPLILGSATPCLETWIQACPTPTPHSRSADAHGGSPHPSLYLSLPSRIHARPLPPIEVVDMRQELQCGNPSIFSRSLRSALQGLQAQQQQGILFIHRRGHSTFVSCRSCGYVMTCPDCDVALAYHQLQAEAASLLRCHYCNYVCAAPKNCPQCQSPYFKYFGSGTQRVVQELNRQFPELRVLRFDSDTTRTKGAHRTLLTQFAEGEADLLVGTQMLTKGIDLPQVTLVGIVAADGLLNLPDYRASERAFQTLTQVAGRCGRGDNPGRVVLQTYTPEHPVIQAVQRQDYPAFVATELAHRSDLRYPPANRLILLRLSSPNPVAVQQAAERVAIALAPLRSQHIEILGPAPATILRVARRYRWQILLKLPLETGPLSLETAALRAVCPESVSLTIDVDPLTIG